MTADDGPGVEASEASPPNETASPPVSLAEKSKIAPLGESMVELFPDHVRFTSVHNLDAIVDVPREEVAGTIRYLAAHPAGVFTYASFKRGAAVTLRGTGADEQEAMLRWLAPHEAPMLARLARRTSKFAVGLIGWQTVSVLFFGTMEPSPFDVVPLICAPLAVGLVVWAYTRPRPPLFTVASLIILAGMGPEAVQMLLDGSYLFGILWGLFVLVVSSAFRTPVGFFRALHRLRRDEPAAG